MAKILEILTDEQREQLTSNFLINTGDRLRKVRKQRCVSLDELAKGMPVEKSMLSRYETGKNDMPLSYLSLYSIYCDFELRELFPSDEMKNLLSSFKASVVVISGSNARRKEKDSSSKTLTARIYIQDGMEIREEIRSKTETQRNMYKNAQIPAEVCPFSEEEFCEYLMSFNSEVKDSVCSAGEFLKQIMAEPKKETLKKAVADYIIDEIIIDRVSSKYADNTAKRAYAYYKLLMEHIDDDDPKGIDRLS